MNTLHRQTPTLAQLRAKREEIRSLAQRYGAYEVRVFGSVARGDANEDSDIDFLVTFEKHSLLDRIALQRHLSELLAHDVDIMTEKMLKPHVRL